MAATALIRDAVRDTMLALRMLGRRPGFAAVALITLALGIGTPTAIFSVVNAVLIRPLPYLQPDRIVSFRISAETPAGPFSFDAIPVSSAIEWNAGSRTLEGLAVYNDRALTLTTADGPFRLSGISATPNLFTLLGSSPALGRPFATGDSDSHQVVLSDATWRRYFHGDAAIVNSTVTLDGDAYRVTAVMPPGFRFPTTDAAFWVPQVIDAGGSRGMVLPAIARLRPGVSPSAAVAEGTTFLGDSGDPRIQQTLSARTLQEQLVGGVSRVLWILMAAVSLVSVIATMNIALLLLTRGATREREFSIRLALGAGRWRLARQLFAEGLTLAVLGGTIGLVVAGLGLRALMTLAPADLPRLHEAGIDRAVLLFASAVTLAASVIFGVLSAARVLAFDVLRRLTGPAAEVRIAVVAPGRRRLNALAATELALTMVLLVGAGLLLRSFVALVVMPQGFEPRGAVAFQVNLPTARYPGADARLAFLDQLRDRASQLSGVSAAGLAAELPNRQPTGRFAFAANPADLTGDPMTMPVFPTRMVSESFIEAMGITIRAGRAFAATDRTGAEPVVIISELLARRQFNDRDPIGQLLYSQSGNRRVVGVVSDVRPAEAGAEVQPAAYVPLRQSINILSWHSSMNIVVRGADPSSLQKALRALVLSLDPSLPPSNLRPLSDDVTAVVAAPRFSAMVLAIFATIALGMASIGVYGVLAFVATQRTREIGIRVALGATTREVFALMMRDGAAIVASGLGAGLLAALWSARALTSLLHEVTAADPFAIVVVSVVLSLAGLLAAYVPASKAARVNVVSALKDD